MDNLPPFRDLTLILTEQCNLGCSFCYVPRTSLRMDEDMAGRAVDHFLGRAHGGGQRSLSFFGGEPFLERKLMERLIGRARSHRKELSFSAPTNGTLLHGAALDLVGESGLCLALSIDGVTPSTERRTLEGEGTLAKVRHLAPALDACGGLVRMTVTPGTVADLAQNIIALAGMGFRRIMHQPALEVPWSGGAIQIWRDQHKDLADWACERYEAGESLPDLTVLEGIVGRISGGGGMRYCGAGVTQAAVAPDGRIFGCFRSAYDPNADELVLGHVDGGPANDLLIQTYARLDPRRAKPERGDCRSCDAQDGCTVYCPAMGHARLGDLRAVPADACDLMRAQVAVCRDMSRRMRRIQRQSRRRAAAGVAAAAVMMGLGAGASGCDVTGRKPVTDTGGAKPDSGPQPGVCAVKPDSGPQPGVCPVRPDGGPQPGVCAVRPDSGPQPGVCPVKPDGMIPGLCPPPQPDGGPQPGVCPIKPDQGKPKDRDGGPKPGVCPMPGIC